MTVTYRYSQQFEILEYNLSNMTVSVKCLYPGANYHNLEEGQIYQISFAHEGRVPNIERVIELIRERFYLYND